MPDELLPYYEKELAYIRQLGAEFAKEFPKIAGRLGISGEVIEDPHVSRLIEGFAYLNARIQHKLDDDFPELSDALLSVLYPHYQRPVPSMTIVQFEPDEDKLDATYFIDRNTQVETEQFQGENCRFSSTLPLELLPCKQLLEPGRHGSSKMGSGVLRVLQTELLEAGDGLVVLDPEDMVDPQANRG